VSRSGASAGCVETASTAVVVLFHKQDPRGAVSATWWRERRSCSGEDRAIGVQVGVEARASGTRHEATKVVVRVLGDAWQRLPAHRPTRACS